MGRRPGSCIPPNAGKGRPKGIPNKPKPQPIPLSAEQVSLVFKKAFDELQKTRKSSVLGWAKDNPTEFYRLTARFIPQAIAVQGHNGGAVKMEVSARPMLTPEQWLEAHGVKLSIEGVVIPDLLKLVKGD